MHAGLFSDIFFGSTMNLVEDKKSVPIPIAPIAPIAIGGGNGAFSLWLLAISN